LSLFPLNITELATCIVDFMMGGVSAAVAKTSAAPIERIKLLVQNQDEMVPSFPLDSRDLVFNVSSSTD